MHENSDIVLGWFLVATREFSGEFSLKVHIGAVASLHESLFRSRDGGGEVD